MELVADANVLLSAVLSGKARYVLRHPSISAVYTPVTAYDEVFEYLRPLARRRRLPMGELLLNFAALPVIVVDRQEYERQVSEAKRRIGARDPDDVDVLALALERRCAVWSNDNDFEVGRVEWFTTAEMLSRLDIK